MENIRMQYFSKTFYTCLFLLLFTPKTGNEIEDEETKEKDDDDDDDSSQNDSELEEKKKESLSEGLVEKSEEDENLCIKYNKIIVLFIIFVSFALLYGTHFVQKNFGDVDEEQIEFHLNMKTLGKEAKVYIFSFMIRCVLIPFIFTQIFYYALINSPDYIVFDWMIKLRIKYYTKIVQFLFFIYCLYLFCTQVSVIRLLIPKEDSTFLEDHYVWPTNDLLTFPKKKRNLIFLCLESFETSYSEKKYGGGFIENHIPLMTDQALKNVHFGKEIYLNGGIWTAQAHYSTAGQFAMWAGIPLKCAGKVEKMKSFVPGVITALDILHDRGYDQTVIYGHGDTYGISNLYRTHGKLNVYHADILKKMYPEYKDDDGGWGLSDENLYTIARDIIEKKSAGDKPFTLVVNTIETHFPNGIKCRLCRNETIEKYLNVIRCADRQANAFLEYLKTTPKYNETTIIVVGDHLSMSSKMGKWLKNHHRKIFHTIINPALEKPFTPTNNRLFTTYDWFPTILASLGFKIKGERLGFGTNLFSNKKTYVEELGVWKFMSNVAKPSRYYDKYLMLSGDQYIIRVNVSGKWMDQYTSNLTSPEVK
jgi:phosphoglycerol transferase